MLKFLLSFFVFNLCFSQTIEEAFILKSQLKYDEALAIFEKTNDKNKRLYMSQIYEIQEFYIKAITEINKYLDENKNDINAKIYLGQVYFKAKNFNLLISNYESFKENEHIDNTYYTLGLAYQETRDFIKAQQCFIKTLEKNPNHLKAMYKMSVHYAQIKNYNEAYEYINKALKLSSLNVDFLALKAQLDFATEKWAACINTVMLLNRNGYKTENQYFMMAKSYANIKQHKDAIDYLNYIIETYETDNASVYYHLGLNYGFNKQYDLAEKNLLKTIEMNKNSFENEYYYLGEFSKEQNVNKAINYYKKAINEKPDMFFAHYQLLMVDLETKEKKTQLKLIENFKAKHKDMPKEYHDFFDSKIQHLKREIHLE
jgi:tetratricopeptide (TPR) repeat protein